MTLIISDMGIKITEEKKAKDLRLVLFLDKAY